MVLADHPNVKHAGVEHQIIGDKLEVITVVYTDLQLDGMHPDYDKAKVDSLIEAVRAYQKGNPFAQNVRIVTNR